MDQKLDFFFPFVNWDTFLFRIFSPRPPLLTSCFVHSDTLGFLNRTYLCKNFLCFCSGSGKIVLLIFLPTIVCISLVAQNLLPVVLQYGPSQFFCQSLWKIHDTYQKLIKRLLQPLLDALSFTWLMVKTRLCTIVSCNFMSCCL